MPETDTPTAEAALGAPTKGRARTGTTGTRLVIVESPAKAKKIASFLGPGYVVESSIGHIRDLPRNAADVPDRARPYVGAPRAAPTSDEAVGTSVSGTALQGVGTAAAPARGLGRLAVAGQTVTDRASR